jgi:multiple antibiotic resistance protein
VKIQLFSTALTIFLVLNPLGNVPSFITILQPVAPERRQKVIFRECAFALLILVLFLFAGHAILNGLRVTDSALGVAGGLILFLIAIRYIFPPMRPEKDKVPTAEPFLVPLAIPMVSGPAAMATVMLLSSQHQGASLEILLSLFCAWVPVTLILLSCSFLSRILGSRGLTALERLMGMILAVIAVQMFLSGIEHFFHLTP